MHSTFEEILRIEESLLKSTPARMQSVQNQNMLNEDCIRARLEQDPKLQQQLKEYEGLAERAAEKASLLRRQRQDHIAKKVFPEAAGNARNQVLEQWRNCGKPVQEPGQPRHMDRQRDGRC